MPNIAGTPHHLDDDTPPYTAPEQASKVEIRKYSYPTMKVYYKGVHVGDIENEQEFLMFKMDMVENPEHNLFHLKTPKGTIIEIDAFGITNYCEEVESLMELYKQIIEKQMDYRLRKLDVGS